MVEIPQNIKTLLFGFGPQMHAVMALITNLLAIATTILGIISAAKKISLGLGATHWFMLAIILFIWGLSFWFGAYFGAKEGYSG
jgi:hypothetical protein